MRPAIHAYSIYILTKHYIKAKVMPLPLPASLLHAVLKFYGPSKRLPPRPVGISIQREKYTCSLWVHEFLGRPTPVALTSPVWSDLEAHGGILGIAHITSPPRGPKEKGVGCSRPSAVYVLDRLSDRHHSHDKKRKKQGNWRGWANDLFALALSRQPFSRSEFCLFLVLHFLNSRCGEVNLPSLT